MEVNYPFSYFPMLFGAFGMKECGEALSVGILFPIEDQYMKVIAKELQTQNVRFVQPGGLLLTNGAGFHILQRVKQMLQVDACSDHQAVCRVLGRKDWPGSRKISAKSYL